MSCVAVLLTSVLSIFKCASYILERLTIYANKKGCNRKEQISLCIRVLISAFILAMRTRSSYANKGLLKLNMPVLSSLFEIISGQGSV